MYPLRYLISMLCTNTKTSTSETSMVAFPTIDQMARTMRIHARLGNHFFYHSCRHASYALNRLCPKGLQDEHGVPTTPHYKAFNRKPRIGHMRVFGCLDAPSVSAATLHHRKAAEFPRSNKLKDLPSAASSLVSLRSKQDISYIWKTASARRTSRSHTTSFRRSGCLPKAGLSRLKLPI